MLKRYSLPSIKGEGYAEIVLDTSDGYFSTISDFGNYCYHWHNHGYQVRYGYSGL